MPPVPAPTRVALLLSTRYFEDFYGRGLGLSRSEYLTGYRNDWSWDWCRMLRSHGVEPAIYVPTIAAAQGALTDDGYVVRFLPLGAIATPWLRLPILERSPPGRYVGQVVNCAAFLRPLRSAMRADRVNVLCVQEYWTGRFDVLARVLGRRVVPVDQGLPDRREVKLLKRGAFARCGEAIVQTEQQAESVRFRGGRARRIPNAVDTRRFSPSVGRERESDRIILCVGRIHDAQKRLSDVITALARLPVTWRLEIAGSGPDRPALETLAGRLGVSERVSYLGFISGASPLQELYRRATVLALPSAYEGLPMVLLEAMSCGTPVVGSDIPAIAEVIDDGYSGILVPVGDSERLAEALLEVAERRSELGEAARALIKEGYDQAVVGPQLAALLQRAAGAATVPA